MCAVLIRVTVHFAEIWVFFHPYDCVSHSRCSCLFTLIWFSMALIDREFILIIHLLSFKCQESCQFQMTFFSSLRMRIDAIAWIMLLSILNFLSRFNNRLRRYRTGHEETISLLFITMCYMLTNKCLLYVKIVPSFIFIFFKNN